MKLATENEVEKARKWLEELAAYPSFVTFRRGAFPVQVPVEEVMANYHKLQSKLKRGKS